jgi:GNAT superfamily N-acetyltransferase
MRGAPAPHRDDIAPVTVRPARGDELPGAAAIYATIEVEADRRIHPLARPIDADDVARAKTDAALADLRLLHDDDPRQVIVAETERAIVGFAAAVFRGRHAHVQYLFVAPEAQGGGVGRVLLAGVGGAGRDAGCTVFTLQASDDPRALTRYFRFGLRPHAPNVVWSADKPVFPEPGLGNRLEPVLLQMEDIAALNTLDDIDKAVRGVRRRQDIERWLREGAMGALLVDRVSGKPAGYYLVAMDSGSGRLGPVAALEETRFGDVFASALAAAASRHIADVIWKVDTSGENHAVTAPLLAAGFRPVYTTTFFASEPIGRFDRYVFHDLDFL